VVNCAGGNPGHGGRKEIFWGNSVVVNRSREKTVTSFVMAIDQGTTSTRAMIFDSHGEVCSLAQKEHQQIFPHSGWVEHDPKEIWANVVEVSREALQASGLVAGDIAAIGVTNQRETAIVWERETGEPVYHAIVWQDTRSQDIVDGWSTRPDGDAWRKKTGLPLATYFSASKIVWMLENVPGLAERARRGDVLFGTPDTWVLWNLTGGPRGGVHATDVTNASRTLLMDLETLDWDDDLLNMCGIPRAMMPEIRPSLGEFGRVVVPQELAGISVTGILGDQQAATFGQAALHPGGSKSTYGTGSFLLVNTGEEIVHSTNGLITTVAYQEAGQAPRYALEGSIAVTGSLIQWLRDNLGLISDASEVEELAASVSDNGGVHIVPAFSGLFAPHWRSDARGVIVGLTRYATKAHFARAALESTAFQTREVLDAVNSDFGIPLTELRVDGGMTSNALLLQFQADILGIPVVRPKVLETTALGVAYAAGVAAGVWESMADVESNWKEDARFLPSLSAEEREKRFRVWKKAVAKSLDWVDSA
jgi:glycerol kinase